MNYIQRQGKIVDSLKKERVQAFLVRKKENIAYLTGARGDDAVLFVSPKNKILITDSRYEEEYKRFARGCSVAIAKNKNLGQAVSEACAKADLRRIGFEAGNFTYEGYLNLKKTLGKRTLIPLVQTVENIRIVKDNHEINYIRQACKNGAILMNYAINNIKEGVTENRLKLMIEVHALKNNFNLAGFDIIIASGKNASLPHAAASGKAIGKQQMVIIDLGAMYSGYNSDLTRTVFLGRISHKYLRIYEIVLAAQLKAIEKLKPGVYAKDIDAVSRQYISDRGMGSFFLHSLGHGIGRETHEIPAISQNSNVRLEKGMVVTIEPGVYISGWGGVRIEDTVLITEKGCEVLTKGAIKNAGRD